MERVFRDGWNGLREDWSMDGDDEILLCGTIIHCEKEASKIRLLSLSKE